MYEILVVDDEVSILEATCDLLRHKFKDISLTTATSGYEAIQIIQNVKFDIVISDYNMRNGNGGDVLKHLIATNQNCHFILFTSHLFPQLPAQSYKYFRGVIEKTNSEDLVIAISKFQNS